MYYIWKMWKLNIEKILFRNRPNKVHPNITGIELEHPNKLLAFKDLARVNLCKMER